jgi:D-alanyl-lipoteichoic acid acyltransferase DltB (MBOAT superfamily)
LALSSSAYFLFLIGVFLLYWPLARHRAAALGAILFANYFFYARWDILYLALIPAASTCDYLLGLGLRRAQGKLARRLLVAASVVLNLGLLASLKYTPFALENWSAWSGREVPAWNLVLPVSLSFYVFQALTYTIDVYRREIPGTRSYLAHLAAVSFFPTVLAGPITRVGALIEQMERRAPLEPREGGKALFLIGMGLIKKLLIADYLAHNLVDRIFDFPNLYTGAEVLAAVYAYTFQIYYDFSGYTDIALGSALLVGIKLPANFNRPYAAANLAEFWRRWHITLSSWLRDYLYFALGGARSRWRPYLNLIVTMTLAGLWHGANWNFVVWGALHGIGLAAVRMWQVARRKHGAAPAPVLGRYAGIALTFHFVAFAWVFFRAPSLETASAVLGRIGSLTVSFANMSGALWVILAIALAAHYLPARIYNAGLDRFARAPFYAQAAALAALAAGLQYSASTGAAPFIYTNF